MRAIRLLCLAPLALMTAAAIAAGPTHHGDAASHHARPLAGSFCPAGSNWDNILQRCV